MSNCGFLDSLWRVWTIGGSGPLSTFGGPGIKTSPCISQKVQDLGLQCNKTDKGVRSTGSGLDPRVVPWALEVRLRSPFGDIGPYIVPISVYPSSGYDLMGTTQDPMIRLVSRFSETGPA